jgi:hypothetical protein
MGGNLYAGLRNKEESLDSGGALVQLRSARHALCLLIYRGDADEHEKSKKPHIHIDGFPTVPDFGIEGKACPGGKNGTKLPFSC